MGNRALPDRQNMGFFPSGQTGSGKTRMLARLLKVWKRKLVIDPMRSLPVPENAIVTKTYEQTVQALHEHYQKGPFYIVVRYKNDEEYAKLYAGLRRLIEKAVEEDRNDSEPWALIIDEVDRVSEPTWIDPNLDYILVYGRHVCMSWAVACRADIETHRSVRMNAVCILFRQGMLSPEMRRKLKDAEIVREEPLPPIGRLTLHGKDEPPEAVEGVHFVCVPDKFDVAFARWCELAEMA